MKSFCQNFEVDSLLSILLIGAAVLSYMKGYF